MSFAVKSVSTREAAEFYGIKVRRTGMACCPFHDDKNPSMKVDQRFHCFGCGADGDVIDFTAKLFDLSPKEAAEKLAQDFGLIYDSQAPPIFSADSSNRTVRSSDLDYITEMRCEKHPYSQGICAREGVEY